VSDGEGRQAAFNFHTAVRKANRLHYERESVLSRWGEQALVLCEGPGLFFVRTLLPMVPVVESAVPSNRVAEVGEEIIGTAAEPEKSATRLPVLLCSAGNSRAERSE
jgi:hypothetical protein